MFRSTIAAAAPAAAAAACASPPTRTPITPETSNGTKAVKQQAE